jgi:formylglycine-generating enzyme required for sulfatase activity
MGIGEKGRKSVIVEATLTGSAIASPIAGVTPPAVIPEGSQPADMVPPCPSLGGVPDSFDGYVLMRPIGRGGMGEVYLAQDTVLDRAVAVKVIASLEPGPVARERFLREARAIARLQHPNVVAVYRAGEVAGQPYLVSELVRGGSLDGMEFPLPRERLLRACIGLASGLAAAHRRGVLHRDLKPANALVADDGEVKLCDFGLAKLVEVADGPHSAAATTTSNDGSELTRAGAYLGTPRYMAPEIWRSEPATVQTDLYSLGAMFYKLASGRASTEATNIEELRTEALAGRTRPLAGVAPDLDRRFQALVDRCLALDPGARPASADEVLAELIVLATPAAKTPAGNPYRGLRAFDAEHRALFFGRQAEALAVLERLRSEAIVVVAGDSGVGKSSLCRAGVLPLVIDGALHEERTWAAVRVVPGRHPLVELVRALAPIVEGGEADLLEQLRGDPRMVARRLRAGLGNARGILLLIDQLEEFVTEADTGERDLAAVALAELAGRLPGVRVLASARGDFLTRLAALPGLGREMSRALYLLGPLDRTQRREAIIGPARAGGLSFESEALVDTLVEAAEASPAALPLLQFALAELWERRDVARGMIPAASLEAIGGVEGALARHADGVIATLSPDERKQARRLLTQLVTVDGTRAYRGEAELVGDTDATRAALSALVRGRLLSVHSDDDGKPVYSVAHEALLSGWSTLRGWLDRDAERRAVHERVATAASEWERLGGARSVLWGAPQLAEASRVDLRASVAGRERGFLDASLREARRRVWRRRLMIVVAPLLVAALWAGMALKTKIDRNRAVVAQLELAKPELAAWEGVRAAAIAHRSAAFAMFDLGASENAETIWATALMLYRASEKPFALATGTLETANQLDSGAPEVRSILTRLLYERALLAEAFHQDASMAEAIGRLAQLDSEKLWVSQWDKAAQVNIESLNAIASIEIAQYQDRSSQRSLTQTRARGQTPFSTSLGPGSYLFVLTYPDGTQIRYPALLSRGESRSVRITRPDYLPKGFAYIPSGPFLFGSRDADDIRQDVFLAQPEHQTWTHGYGIAREETTWNDWIDFLLAQPKAERATFIPNADGLRLEANDNGTFSFTFRPNSKEYRANWGEPIVYPSRKVNRSQDWRRLPATGISSDQALAYTRWLSATNRVPRARLCTDQEWERAARGADERVYPNGFELSPADANFDETYGRDPDSFGLDETGSHPRSDSPFGISDLAGNAWEYVTSAHVPGTIFIRSGGFYQQRTAQRSTNREPTERELRAKDIGMRVCADL